VAIKSAVSFVLALSVAGFDVNAESNGFFGDIGDAIDDVFTSDSPPPRHSYRYASRNIARGSGSSVRAWSVTTLNGSVVATDSNGLVISHDRSGAVFFSISTKNQLPTTSENLEVSFSFNNEPIVVVPAKIQGQTVVIDEQAKMPLLVEMFKTKRSYEITSSVFKISGALSGSSKALEAVEQAGQISAALGSNAPAGGVTINSTVIHEVDNREPSVAALSESDQKKLEAAADGVANLSAQIELLKKMLEDQKGLAVKATGDEKSTVDATLAIINIQIENRIKEQQVESQKLQGYLTSIMPNNRNQYLSARKASEVFPRIPYYIPGTPETGEFWVEPIVTEKGEQRFKFHFIDPKATADVKRETIEMDREELAQVKDGLFKLYLWSEKAQEEKIRRIFSKRAVCFPAVECPQDGEQGELGKSSTEIRFQIYEDGSTAGRMQRNKGRFSDGYNMSIDSAMLLQAYAAFVLKESDADFKQGTRSKGDLDAMFK
jgi:hypothetical protein